jgi:hypothetical protein
MTRRPAVTLIEVLVTMFIMAIGMLALLALFPLGAVSMGQALKDDRCASAASMAEQFAIALNVRHDSLITQHPMIPPPGQANLFVTQWPQTPVTVPPVSLPATYTGPSFPVYVDPYFASSLPQLGTLPQSITTGLIARTTVSYATGPRRMDRYFTLPNDIRFLPDGTPDLTGGTVERGREYSWAYLLRRPQAWSHEAVDLSVVVYRKRSTAVPDQEQTYLVNPAVTQGGNGLILTWNPAMQPAPNLRRGSWLLDTTTIAGTGANGIPPVPRGDFYRVVNVSEVTANQAVVDVQPNVMGGVLSQVVVMDNVVEVFAKGTSWQP